MLGKIFNMCFAIMFTLYLVILVERFSNFEYRGDMLLLFPLVIVGFGLLVFIFMRVLNMLFRREIITNRNIISIGLTGGRKIRKIPISEITKVVANSATVYFGTDQLMHVTYVKDYENFAKKLNEQINLEKTNKLK